MNKMLQTARYLSKGFITMTVISFLCILGSVAMTNLIFYVTDRYDAQITDRTLVVITAPLEFTAGLFALLIGLILIVVNFKVALANGVSRKTYILANLPVALLAAAAMAIFNQLMVMISGRFWPVMLISDMIYPHATWAGMLLLQFGLYALLMVAGWFITLAYYRSSVPMKWVISIAPFALLRTQHLYAQQHSLSGWLPFINLAFSTPARAGITYFVLAALLYGFVYLLIRRAPLKG